MTFPTDDITLSMLEAACHPDVDGSSHLVDFLSFGQEETGSIVMTTDEGDAIEFLTFVGGYSVNEAILALIAAIRGERVHREALNDITNDAERRLLAQRWWLSMALAASWAVLALVLVQR